LIRRRKHRVVNVRDNDQLAARVSLTAWSAATVSAKGGHRPTELGASISAAVG